MKKNVHSRRYGELRESGNDCSERCKKLATRTRREKKYRELVIRVDRMICSVMKHLSVGCKVPALSHGNETMKPGSKPLVLRARNGHVTTSSGPERNRSQGTKKASLRRLQQQGLDHIEDTLAGS